MVFHRPRAANFTRRSMAQIAPEMRPPGAGTARPRVPRVTKT